ncbi:hypothetical protein Cgig2_004898 [Carnegiea gigantea]|uniref:SHSP domain-containing protein n=1 Tax=Carnegiea gigantea TaxID=171969 RepID=A0A9Q1QS74_9CARY|nr:hypothetical protein Cgig2_004898 [Carnegiea gigantea]
MSLIPGLFGQRTNVLDPFSLDLWDPFQGFFSTALSNVPLAQETSGFVTPRVDWKETPEAHIFKLDLPGLKREEVKVEVEDGRILRISGERSREKGDKNDKWHRVERSSGKFLRRFRLPENVKMDQVKATMENGVLTVIVPKEEPKKPEVKTIEGKKLIKTGDADDAREVSGAEETPKNEEEDDYEGYASEFDEPDHRYDDSDSDDHVNDDFADEDHGDSASYKSDSDDESVDSAPEKEFYSMNGHCFEAKQNKYVYEVCPLKKASRDEGHSTTRLGSWEKFENTYKSMLFSNGDRCRNGPGRSMKVKLRCGLKNELTDVDEPSRCNYIQSPLLSPSSSSLLVCVMTAGHNSIISLQVCCFVIHSKCLLRGKAQGIATEVDGLNVQAPSDHDEQSISVVAVCETAAFANARIDWKETPEAHIFKADLPGLKKEEVKVEVEDGGVLQISGERRKEMEEKNDTWHRVERSPGKFLRRFRLPENVKMEEIKASMENGVLTVTVPKFEEKKPEAKAIEVCGN